MLHLFLCILLAGDIATNPGPTCKTTNFSIKCATVNARSLKSVHKDVTTNSTICNLERFQDFVYGENLDVVCVNETWLNENISNVEILVVVVVVATLFNKGKTHYSQRLKNLWPSLY